MAKENNNSWSFTVLRIVLGIIFAAHGYAKLFVPGGFTGTYNFFKAIGIPLAAYSALIVSVVEFAGGILLILGLLSRWASAVIFIQMLVALFKVHLQNGFFVSKGGYEFVLLILAALLVVVVKGPGALSAGKKYFKSKQMH